ncbi:hypothetical protein HU200_012738 [Digitaria exilis]|uniref:Uncharacterized protein n=1 Tax=Digitaria exilis TaxID=1010633 RepID=A0A835FEW5_9POAL|nr:hypothetical protein HU200_012738 [Digitaria exilis]
MWGVSFSRHGEFYSDALMRLKLKLKLALKA